MGGGKPKQGPTPGLNRDEPYSRVKVPQGKGHGDGASGSWEGGGWSQAGQRGGRRRFETHSSAAGAPPSSTSPKRRAVEAERLPALHASCLLTFGLSKTSGLWFSMLPSTVPPEDSGPGRFVAAEPPRRPPAGQAPPSQQPLPGRACRVCEELQAGQPGRRAFPALLLRSPPVTGGANGGVGREGSTGRQLP